LGQLDLELCDLMRCRCDSGKDVTRQQAHSEPVRIVKNDRVVDGQAKRRGGRHGRSQRALHLRWLHPADFLTAAGLYSLRLLVSLSGFAPGRRGGWPWCVVAGLCCGQLGEVGVGFAGEIAFEAAEDFGLGLAFGGAAGDVVLGGLVAVHPDQGDPPQGAVGVAVSRGSPPEGCPTMESMGRKRPRPRRSFTPEFKAEIVELCWRGDRSVGPGRA
jgi:hypothetical protein